MTSTNSKINFGYVALRQHPTHHQYTDASSPSHSPKSADSYTFTATEETSRPKSPTHCTGQDGGGPIKLTPDAATSNAVYASRP